MFQIPEDIEPEFKERLERILKHTLDQFKGRQYLTLEEVAQYYGVSVRTVYRWIKDGSLKSEKGRSGLRRVPLSALIEDVMQGILRSYYLYKQKQANTGQFQHKPQDQT